MRRIIVGVVTLACFALAGLGIAALGGSTGPALAVGDPSPAGTATTLPVTTTTLVCPQPLRMLNLTGPGTATVDASGFESAWLIHVPVGSKIVFTLHNGDGCNGPEWGAPTVAPAGVIEGTDGSDVTVGTNASATYDAVAVGHTFVTFPGTCPGGGNACARHDLEAEIFVVAAAASSTTTTTTAVKPAAPELPHTS
jgi:hypothetical protein